MNYCFDAIYIDTLLTEVYGFSPEDFEKIEFINEVRISVRLMSRIV